MVWGFEMKHLNIFLLSSGAALAALSAQAADLPTRKAAPAAEYVKVCNTFGAGFFVIPGSDTCIKLGGVVRYEANYRGGAPSGVLNQFAYNLAGTAYPRDAFFERGRGYISADVREQTGYGELKSFFNLRYTQDTLPPGPFGGGKVSVAGLPAGVKENAGLFQGLPNSQFYIDAAYVQWAGLTAGTAHSFFDFYTHNYEIQSLTFGGSDQPLLLAAYTAKFAGFSATVSAEDAAARRIGDSLADTGAGDNNPAIVAPGKPPIAAYLTYGSIKMPDFVGALRYDGGWGSAQVAGALHEVNSAPIFGTPGALPVGFTPGSKTGFALDAGVKIKLDAISPGDSATAQVTYTQGALDYVNAVNYYAGTSNVYASNQSIGIPVNDAFVLPNGSIALAKATGAFAGFQHYWVPTVRSALFGSYMQITNPAAAQALTAGADNAKVYDIGFNTFWSPVKALDIGAEIVYTHLNLSGVPAKQFTVQPNSSASTLPIPGNSNDVRGRLRIQVTF